MIQLDELIAEILSILQNHPSEIENVLLKIPTSLIEAVFQKIQPELDRLGYSLQEENSKKENSPKKKKKEPKQPISVESNPDDPINQLREKYRIPPNAQLINIAHPEVGYYYNNKKIFLNKVD